MHFGCCGPTWRVSLSLCHCRLSSCVVGFVGCRVGVGFVRAVFCDLCVLDCNLTLFTEMVDGVHPCAEHLRCNIRKSCFHIVFDRCHYEAATLIKPQRHCKVVWSSRPQN